MHTLCLAIAFGTIGGILGHKKTIEWDYDWSDPPLTVFGVLLGGMMGVIISCPFPL